MTLGTPFYLGIQSFVFNNPNTCDVMCHVLVDVERNKRRIQRHKGTVVVWWWWWWCCLVVVCGLWCSTRVQHAKNQMCFGCSTRVQHAKKSDVFWVNLYSRYISHAWKKNPLTYTQTTILLERTTHTHASWTDRHTNLHTRIHTHAHTHRLNGLINPLVKL